LVKPQPDPEILGQDFIGWFTDEQTPVQVNFPYTLTGDTALVAHFTPHQYTVIFYDEDGSTVLDTQYVNYGDTAIFAGTTPSKADDQQCTYAWDNKWYTSVAGDEEADLTNVTADKDVYAKYGCTLQQYTVTFYNEDGTQSL
jgi:hypothetical protein